MCVCGISQEKNTPGNCQSSWVVPGWGLSLLGAFPLWARGWWKARLPPGSLLHWPHPTPDWGSTSHPMPQLLGTSQGSSAASSAPFSTFPVSLTEGVFVFFYFWFFVLSPSSLFSKDAAGQRAGRGLSAHLAQGSEKGKPRASGDQLQYCTSWLVARGCVASASGAPFDLGLCPCLSPPPTPSPPCPSLGLVVLSKAVPVRLRHALQGWAYRPVRMPVTVMPCSSPNKDIWSILLCLLCDCLRLLLFCVCGDLLAAPPAF